jgi:hypothetical protein
VGDRASFEAARGAHGGGITAAAGSADEAALPRLDQDTSAFTPERALAQFTADQMGVRARPRARGAAVVSQAEGRRVWRMCIAIDDCCRHTRRLSPALRRTCSWRTCPASTHCT